MNELPNNDSPDFPGDSLESMIVGARQTLDVAKVSVDRALESVVPAVARGSVDQTIEFQLRDVEAGLQFALSVFEHEPLRSFLSSEEQRD